MPTRPCVCVRDWTKWTTHKSHYDVTAGCLSNSQQVLCTECSDWRGDYWLDAGLLLPSHKTCGAALRYFMMFSLLLQAECDLFDTSEYVRAQCRHIVRPSPSLCSALRIPTILTPIFDLSSWKLAHRLLLLPCGMKNVHTIFFSYVFLRATAGTAIARLIAIAILSVRPSVRLSVTRVDQAKTVQAIGSSNLHHRLPQRL